MGLHFEDPPPAARLGSRVDHAAVAAELKARPGEWAIVGTHATGGAANTAAGRIKSGHPHAYRPAGAFDAVGRTVNGEHRTYAMYRGEGT
ncbi:hypothetical protein [Streptomyces sp. OK228]|uniref:hypothetical protein n=1 Tax=Streptomyces sp. OK228 TaxID=1882786 RepID=UPI000BCB4265|nr:hypothetical protein [Streptomyces sp. OK228]SOE25648.1 hypothetical protein SAMN05442782_2391 [Streptomyces sp. OK228]